jgi:hypothetical protein
MSSNVTFQSKIALLALNIYLYAARYVACRAKREAWVRE